MRTQRGPQRRAVDELSGKVVSRALLWVDMKTHGSHRDGLQAEILLLDAIQAFMDFRQ